jgi:hypothetical protein
MKVKSSILLENVVYQSIFSSTEQSVRKHITKEIYDFLDVILYDRLVLLVKREFSHDER